MAEPRKDTPPPRRKPHRWDPESASKAGRKGGSQPKRPKGFGKGRLK